MIEPLVGLLPVKTKNLSFDYKAKRFIAGSKYDPVTRHHVWFGSFTPEEQEQLLTPDVLAQAALISIATHGRCGMNATQTISWSECKALTRSFISPKTF